MSTDIAVIEEYNEAGEEWLPFCFIGPDRTDGELSRDYFSERPRLRIIYFDREEE